MPIRIEWDRFEIALLIEACNKVLNEKTNEQNEVEALSFLLRERATCSGIEIDEIFRNKNGISLQMAKMKYVLTHGNLGLPGASKLYYEMADLFENNHDSFSIILQEGKRQIQTAELMHMSKREAFFAWLDEQKKVKYSPSNVASIFEEVSSFAISHGVAKKSIWDMATRTEFSNLHNRLCSMRIFRLQMGKNAKLFDRISRFYKVFLDEYIKTAQSPQAEEKFPKREVTINVPNGQDGKEPVPDTKEILFTPFQRLSQKLYAFSRVYDDPKGFTIDEIIRLTGIEVEDRNKAVDILDESSWATRIAPDTYSFSPVAKPYIETSYSSETSVSSECSQEQRDRYIQVLRTRFQGGMRFDSIDLEIFRDTFNDCFKSDITDSDDDLVKALKNCGIVYHDRLFAADTIIDGTTAEKLFSHIESIFASGKKLIYYKAIMSDLSDDFAHCYSLSDEEMLRCFLEYSLQDKGFYFNNEFVSSKRIIVTDHTQEIADYMLAQGKPLSYEEVSAGLPHIPIEKITNIIRANKVFLRDAKEHYYHIGIFEISPEELQKIDVMICHTIEEDGYALWADIYNRIKEELPTFIELNLYLSSLGIRNAISQKLNDKYSFDGAVISRYEDHLAMSGVYRLWAKHHTPFSDEDLYNFSKEVDCQIYFSAVASSAVRVSRNEFISPNQIVFDTDAIDKAIASFMSKDYIKIRDVDSFLSFPNVGYHWNEYLLEQYTCYYSKKFVLLNNGQSLNNVTGVIAKRNGAIKTFEDACAEVLADSGISLKKDEALNYLADVNMITRRTYKDIESAISKASQIRLRKG